MKYIKEYVNQIFEDFDDNEETQKVKTAIYNELSNKYEKLIEDNFSPKDAMLKIKIEFGTKECIIHRINENRSMNNYEKFKKFHPLLKKSGLAALLIITVFAMTLAGTTELKIESLITWVILIILLVLFEIIVEYIDYYYNRRYSYINSNHSQIKKKKTNGDVESSKEHTQEVK